MAAGDLVVNCTNTDEFPSILKLLIYEGDGTTPFIDCSNQWEDWLSILKQLVVEDADGNLALSVTIGGAKFNDITPLDAATYDVLPTDNIIHVIHTVTAAVAIDLPSAQVVDGRTITINDGGGQAGTRNITITTEGAELIDGFATDVISGNWGSVKYYAYDGNWFTL